LGKVEANDNMCCILDWNFYFPFMIWTYDRIKTCSVMHLDLILSLVR
jgi:hypothetical protein